MNNFLNVHYLIKINNGTGNLKEHHLFECPIMLLYIKQQEHKSMKYFSNKSLVNNMMNHIHQLFY